MRNLCPSEMGLESASMRKGSGAEVPAHRSFQNIPKSQLKITILRQTFPFFVNFDENFHVFSKFLKIYSDFSRKFDQIIRNLKSIHLFGSRGLANLSKS